MTEPRPPQAALASILAVLLVALIVSSAGASRLKSRHLYNLSNFAGTVPCDSARVYADEHHGELYVTSGGDIKVFDSAGMEIFRFGVDSDLGMIAGISVESSGDIYILSYGGQPDPASGTGFNIAWCNYRGEVRDRIRISGIPAAYSGFAAHYMFRVGEKFLLVDRMRMLAMEVDRDGAFVTGYDLGTLIGVEEKDRPNTEIFGFSVDKEGNMFFTVPVLFQAFRVSPDGKFVAFGRAGSSPGMFGVVTGIAVDGQGNMFISDKRRHVVMVFDRQFRFLHEFGGYGPKRDNLVYPDDLCVDSSGKVYVSQMMKRGISVFQVVNN